MRASGVFYVRLVITFSKYFLPTALAFALPLTATSAATEVGAIPGSFAVGPTGAATYSIPISVPPGIAGLAPHLALTYNSQSGNGLAGYGWTLSGLSVITVCPRTLVDDGTPEIADFSGSSDDANKFCVDGSRLTMTSYGTYGANGAVYRKMIDDFSQFTSHSSGGNGVAVTSGPQYFTMQTPDGLTYEYGNTQDTQIIASGPGVQSGVTVARAWALDKIYDKFGNSVVFNYFQDTGGVDFWPISIVYTTHNGTAGPNKIMFSYDDLTSINPALVWSSYVAGAQVSQLKRLNEIDVDYNGATTFAYTLGYSNTLTDSTGNNQGTERSLLTSVTQCAVSTCYPTTTIQWQPGTSGWGSTNAASMGGNSLTSAEASQMLMLDVNGDGQADIVYPGSTSCPSTGDWMVMLANGNGFSAPIDTGISSNCNSQYAMPIDLQESGKESLLVPHQQSDNSYHWYILSINADGSGTFTDTGLPAIGFGGNATVFDLNGDGLADIVYSDGANIYWYKNKGNGTFITPALTVASGVFSSSSDDVIQFQSRWGGSAANFDGTSTGGYMTLSEINQMPTWTISQGGDAIQESGGSIGMSPATAFGSISGDKGNIVVPMFVDFNGDGLSDVLYANTTTSLWKVYFSTGNSIVGGETSIFWDNSVMRDSLPVDYSGNGRQNVLLPMRNGNGVCTSLGLVGYTNGVFHGDLTLGTSTAYMGACSSGYMSGSIRTADINGDGLQDLVWVANGAVYYALHKGNYPDLVSSISNGFSQNYVISYGALSNGASYTPGNWSYDPLSPPLGVTGYRSAPSVERSYTGPIYVVNNYTFNNGIGSTSTDSFTYTGALINLVGRGFEGFSDVTAYDSRKHGAADSYGTLVDTTYNQSFPLTGTATTVTSWTNTNTQNQGNIASFVNNTYLSVPTQYQGNSQYVYLGTSIVKRYELGAGSTTNVTPTTKITTITTPTIPVTNGGTGVITALDVQSTTSPASPATQTLTSDTNTTFDADTNNWCLSLPSTVTVTNTDNSTGAQLSRSTSYVENTANCRETSESATESVSGEILTKIFTYGDGYGHVTAVAITGVTGGISSTRTTTYCYDSPTVTGNCTSTVAGGTNEFVTSITNALNETANQTWNPALGVVLTATDPNGIQASFTYDGFGLKKQENDADGTYVIWCYGLQSGNCGVSTSLANAAYWVVPTHYSATNQPGASGITIYDNFGRPLQSTGNLLGGTQTNVQTVYDKLGRVSATSTPYTGTAPATWTYTVYDSFDRPLTVYSPAGANSSCSSSFQGETACATQYGYDGLTTSVTDPKGNITSSTADASGRTQSVTDANGGLTQYAYDPFGDLLQTTDAAQNPTTLSYDSWGRKTSMVDPDMGHWTYGYDAFGELTSQTDAKSQTITMAYDPLGRLISKTVPGETGNDTWTFDGPNSVPTAPYIGKLYSMQSGDGNYSRAYQYDSAGRPFEVDAGILGATYSTNTSYDSFGRVATVTYPNQPAPANDDAPIVVANVTATPNPPVVGQTITLDGSQSSDPDNGPQPLSYTWAETSAPQGAQPIAGLPVTGSASNFSFSTNTAGTYGFTLTTSDSVLTSSAATSVTVYPQAIAGLQGSEANPSNGKINLTWTPHTGDGTYNIQQSTNGGAFQQLSGTYSEPAGITGFASGTYQFEVQTCSNSVCTAWSAPVSVTMLRTPSVPATPTLTSSNPSTNGQAKISWTTPSGTVTFYKVFTAEDSGAYDGGTTLGNVHSYTDTGLTSPHTFTYAVEACNTVNGADDCSARSAGVSVKVTSPGVPWPPNLNGPSTVPRGGTANLTWSSNGGTVTSWTLQRNLNGTITTLYTGTGTSFSALLATDNTYIFQVKACNGSGCSAWAGITVIVTDTQDMIQAPTSSTGGGAPTQAPAPSTGAGTAFATPAASSQGSLATVRLLAKETPIDSNVHARVTAQRELGLRRRQAEIARAQYKRDHALADRDFDPRPPSSTLYAAEMAGQGAQAGNPILSVQDAVIAGVAKASDLAPRKLMVGATSRFSVNYVYDANENLTQVVNAANTSIIYWQGTATDAFGHITTEILGNGIVTGRTYDPNTGALQEEASGVGQNPAVADRVYTWDADGNLNTRHDNVRGLTETFGYDNLNRVMTAAVTGGTSSSTLTMSYDAIGNITSKTNPGTGADMGAYAYDPNHPMEIATVTSSANVVRTFQYDNSNGAVGNGNLLSDGIRNYTWDAENRPTQITNTLTGASTSFNYSPDGMRYYENTTGGSDPNSLIEVNGLFEVYTEGGHTSYRNSIAAPTGIVAIYTVRDDNLVTTRYLTTDHLGSSSEVTNEVGVVTEAMSYDVFGAKRDPNTWQTYGFGTGPGTTDVTDKGYTGQQQLDALGLVHMNGRVQDPYTGRFVSADPTVPDPSYSQAFNRFAYVYNNPMNSVDPSGFDVYFLPPNTCPGGTCQLGTITVNAHLASTNIDPSLPADIVGDSAVLPLMSDIGPPAQTGVEAPLPPSATASGNGGNSNANPTTSPRSGNGNNSTATNANGSQTGCVSYGCDSPDGGDNGVLGNMDSTDGATTYDGGVITGDAQGPTGPLGGPLHPVVQVPVNVIALIHNAGPGGPTSKSSAICGGSVGCTTGLNYAIKQYEKVFGRLGPDAHLYSVGPLLVCTNGPSCAMNAALHCNVPVGCVSSALKTGDVVYAGPGMVSVNVDMANHEITNITTSHHLLYPGVVSIGVIQQGNNGFVMFSGVGNGALPGPNVALAPAVWGLTAEEMAHYASSHPQ